MAIYLSKAGDSVVPIQFKFLELNAMLATEISIRIENTLFFVHAQNEQIQKKNRGSFVSMLK